MCRYACGKYGKSTWSLVEITDNFHKNSCGNWYEMFGKHTDVRKSREWFTVIKKKGDKKMGLRAYLMIDVDDEIEQQEFVKELRELEDMPGVDFADPVIGNHDMIVMIDAPVTVEAIATKIREKSWVKNMEILRIVSMFERHRASKKELLQALAHTGV